MKHLRGRDTSRYVPPIPSRVLAAQLLLIADVFRQCDESLDRVI